jgi:hypothetical protein
VKTQLDSRLPTGPHLCYYYKTGAFTSGELQVECGVLISTGRRIFIGVQGGVTHLVKSVTHQVVASWPSHVAGRPQGLASTNFPLRIPCYRLLESVTVKPTRERLQSGAGRPGGLACWPLPRPTGQQPLHNAS